MNEEQFAEMINMLEWILTATYTLVVLTILGFLQRR